MRRSNLLRSVAATAAAGALARPAAALSRGLATVNIGGLLSVSDGALLLAEANGYFRDVGLVLNFQTFNSAADMIASLGTGQLDVAGGAGTAGLYNAVGRGIAMKIVADRGTAKPGYGFSPLVVRKELVTSGKFTSLADLKGLRMAEPAKGAVILCQMVKALGSVGLRYSDVQHAFLGFPAQVAALQNGSIDATFLVEPFATIAKTRGAGVIFEGNDKIYPNQEISVYTYSGRFAREKADVAERFMVAYLRGVRDFLGGLDGPHLTGPKSPEIIPVLARKLKIAPQLLKEITFGYLQPDGEVNVKSLAEDHAIYKAQNLIIGSATVEQIVDMSFVRRATRRLGPYRPQRA